MDEYATWHEGSLGAGNIVLDGDPAPCSQKGGGHSSPLFSAHVLCAQTTGWIKMPLVTEVGLGQGHIVLDGYPAPPQKGHGPQFLAKGLNGSRCHTVLR